MKATLIQGILLMFLCGLSKAFSELDKDDKGYPLLKKLTATCGKDGIKVNVRFSEPFLGIVYSDGHYDNPPCVFINQENHTSLTFTEAETRFSFLIPADECGTVFHDPGSSLSSQLDEDNNNATKVDKNELGNEVYMENTIMFQKNPFIQEQGDVLQKLRCVWQKEIRKPLHATLPLRSKHKHKTEKVKVARPTAPLNYKKIPLQHTIANQQQPIVRTSFLPETSTYKSIPQRVISFERRRYQPIGQVESVFPFSKNRNRDGKSLKYNYPAPIDSDLYSDSFQTMFTSLPNLTALPFKQDDVGRSGSSAIRLGIGTYFWIVFLSNLGILKGLTNIYFFI